MSGSTRSLDSQIRLVSELGVKLVSSLPGDQSVMLDLIASQTDHLLHLLALLDEEFRKRDSHFERALEKSKFQQEQLQHEISFLQRIASLEEQPSASQPLKSSIEDIRKRLGLSSPNMLGSPKMGNSSQIDDLAELKQKLKDQMAQLHKLREPFSAKQTKSTPHAPPFVPNSLSSPIDGKEESEFQAEFDPLAKLVFNRK